MRRERRLRITMRINGVLFICGACFLLRVALLLAHFAQAEAGDERAMLAPGAIVSWYLFATWIPFIVPACTLLLMMRPGAPGFGAGGGGQQPPTPATVGLISSPSHLRGESGKDWGDLLDEPLVSPTAQPLVAREVFARLQRGNLYSPPVGRGRGKEGKGRLLGKGKGGGAMLDLGEEGEEDMSGVDAERKDERTSSAAAAAVVTVAADGKGRVKGDEEEGVPLKQPPPLSVEAV